MKTFQQKYAYFKNLFRLIKLICRISGHQFRKILMD